MNEVTLRRAGLLVLRRENVRGQPITMSVVLVLMYATPALLLKVRQTNELNVCWNMVIREILGYHKWKSVRTVIDGLGRVDVTHLIQLRKIAFYRRVFNL